jgi:uncharacterized membrane protein (UPF0182 family)
VTTAIILWLNGWLAFTYARLPTTFHSNHSNFLTTPDVLEFMRHRLPWPRVIGGVAILVALLVAWGETRNWSIFLQFLRQVPAGANDPLYGNDISFYLFTLPAYVVFKNWMFLTLFLSAILAALVYWVHGEIESDPPSISPTAIAHGSALLGCFFAVKAWSYNLDRYHLLYGDNGVVVDASYTDIHVELPVLWLLMALAVAAALASWSNLKVRTYKLPLAAAVMVFGTSMVLGEMAPALFQRLYVRPNELQLERPYIERNIALTQQAYNLHQVTVAAFPAEQSLAANMLEVNKATPDNIRLWDWRPLMDTYSQMQEIRTYYRFHDVDIDIDRYWLDGSYQAVMLSARELKSSLLPSNAQTWVNRHLLFTHGNGAVMSPVTRKNAEGLPLFYLRDIPPVAAGGPEIREPRIYYGEETDDYIIAKGTTPEFDYPRGKDNVYAAYAGAGGVPVGGIVRRTLFAWYLDDEYLAFELHRR